MGYYIDQNSKGESLPVNGKARALLADGAEHAEWVEFQPNLVCVVENGIFDAAGYCYSESEFDAFNQPDDHRPKTWLLYEAAATLSGYES